MITQRRVRLRMRYRMRHQGGRADPSGARRPRGPRGRAALLLGPVVVLLLAGGIGGWVGRARTPMGDGRLVAVTPAGPEAGLAVGAAGPAPGATPVGPARIVAGVPVGWAPTRAGAIAAAAAYTTAMTAPWFVTDPDRRRQAIAAIAAPGAAARLTREQKDASVVLLAGPLGHGLERAGVRTLLRAGVLGYRVDAATATSTTVSLWVVLLYGNDSGVAPQTMWGTTQVRLVWAGGDWRLDGLRTTPGPVPTPGPQPPGDAAEILDQADAFGEPHYGAHAADGGHDLGHDGGHGGDGG